MRKLLLSAQAMQADNSPAKWTSKQPESSFQDEGYTTGMTHQSRTPHQQAKKVNHHPTRSGINVQAFNTEKKKLDPIGS